MQKSLLSLTVLWYITSVPVIKTTLSTVLCVNAHTIPKATTENGDAISDWIDTAKESEETSCWAVDTSLKCFEGDHLTLVILILSFVTLVYGGLLLIFVFLLAYSEEQLNDTDCWIYKTMGFLYRSYRHGGRRYWEVAIVVRKAVIAFLAFCAQRFDSVLPITGAAVFLTLTMGAQIVVMPYRQNFDALNWSDIFSLFISLLTTLFATMLKNQSLTVDGGRLAISVLCVLINITAFTVFVCYLFKYFVDYIKLSLRDSVTVLDSDTRTLHVLKIWLLSTLQKVTCFMGRSKFDDDSSISSGI